MYARPAGSMLHSQSGRVRWLKKRGVARLKDQEERWSAVEWLVSCCEWKASWLPYQEGGSIQVQSRGGAESRRVCLVGTRAFLPCLRLILLQISRGSLFRIRQCRQRLFEDSCYCANSRCEYAPKDMRGVAKWLILCRYSSPIP